MSVWQSLLLVWVLAALGMSAGWRWQQRHRNAGIVDVLWSFGVGVGAVTTSVTAHGHPAARALVGVFGGIWGVRLAWHLWRRVRSEGEDGRWRHLRSIWGDGAGRWFAMFQAQALLVALFCVPFAIAAGNPAPAVAQTGIACALWLVAMLGEAIADRQLARFRADSRNRGRTCRTGLWRYSRHPNYFFEWLHWFAYAVLAIGAAHAAVAWLGPLIMWVMLRYLSGIPFTEAQALRSRGADYRDYQERTSMLIPWPPRRPRATGRRPPLEDTDHEPR